MKNMELWEKNGDCTKGVFCERVEYTQFSEHRNVISDG